MKYEFVCTNLYKTVQICLYKFVYYTNLLNGTVLKVRIMYHYGFGYVRIYVLLVTCM